MSFQWVAAGAASQIVEFHNIRADRGRRDELMDLAVHPCAAGHFRVADAPDQIVTLCGFADPAERRQVLSQHYADPAWPELRRRSADLIADESVHLMRCLNPGGLRLGPSPRPHVALISELRFQEQIGSYHLWLRLFLRKAGMDPIASFATLEQENEFPAMPVRRNRSEHIALMRPNGIMPELPQELRGMLRYAPQMLVLEPAALPRP